MKLYALCLIKKFCCVLPLGVLGYFLAQLGAIVGYTELQTKVFQSLREIGNATLIALKLELTMVRDCVSLTYLFI